MSNTPNWIFKKLSPIEARIYEAVKNCGECGANKKAIVLQLAEASVYGSCHDYQDPSLAKFIKPSMPKFERNFKSLVKSKVIVCVNKRNSIYKVNEEL